MKRRDFIFTTFLGLLAVACGEEGTGGSTESSGECSRANPSTSISNNHGHTLTISISDITNENAGFYTLTGGHTHQIDLSVSDIQTLKDDLSLTVTSTSNAGHTHQVVIKCVG
jgi:hypothetical protein